MNAPGVSQTKSDKESSSDDYAGVEMRRVFRECLGKVSWIGDLRPDVQFSIKELARKSSRPDTAAIVLLKRLMRYVAGTKDYCLVLEIAAPMTEIVALRYSNWASPRSTSGCVVHYGGNRFCLHSHARTQPVTALSSAEAELIAASVGAAEGKMLQSLVSEVLGKAIPIRLMLDSSAAIGICSRQGVGRVKHLQIRWLWLQQSVHENEVKLGKIPTAENTSDLLTKYLPVTAHQLHTEGVGLMSQEALYGEQVDLDVEPLQQLLLMLEPETEPTAVEHRETRAVSSTDPVVTE